jgi:methyl-accepting chemotaxis protein
VFRTWSIGTKLIAAFLAVAAIAGIIAGVAYYGMSRMNAATAEITANRVPSLVDLSVAKEAQTAIRAAMRQLEVRDAPPATIKAAYDYRTTKLAEAEKALKDYGKYTQTAEEAKLFADFKPKWDVWVVNDAKGIELSQKFRQTGRDADYKAFLAYALGTVAPSYTPADEALTNLVDLNQTEAVRQGQVAESTFTSVLVMLATATLLGVAIAIGLGIVVSRSITRPLEKVISGLNAGSEQVTSAANQVASASQQLAEGANEQASSLEETSSSLEELSSMTRQNTDNAKQADVMSREARESASKGVEAMRAMGDAIKRIKESSDSTAKIIKTIDDIAFQTNLLALNAAVEAARAGEAGKGFAVVAEEVRNLAQRSAAAAKSTADLIEGSQANADNGVSVAGQVAELLQEISGSVEKVTALAAEVAAASEEQSQGIEQLNGAVAQMDRVTQANASNAEESASASEELSAQARELYDMVVVLQSVVRGARREEYAIRSVQPVAAATYVPAPRVAAAVHTTLYPGAGGNGNGHPRESGVLHPASVIPLDDSELKEF